MEYGLKALRERDSGGYRNLAGTAVPSKAGIHHAGWTARATGGKKYGNSLDEVGQRGTSRVPLEPMRLKHAHGIVPDGTGAASTLYGERR